MIYCKELDTNYNTKEELFKALKSNASNIISIKKKNILTGYDVNNPDNSKQVVTNNQTKLKTISNEVNKSLFSDDNYYYLAVNTTNILDSHGDLHVNGLWNKSAKEQSGKNYLVDTHSLTVKDTIVYPDDIEIFVEEVPFKAINLPYEGSTEALIYKFKKESVVNESIKKALEDGKPLQASVKMQYVKMELAMNSNSKEDQEEKKVYDEYKHKIANLSEFKEEPLYFFVIKEAKNIHESSLVPFGSNSATGMIQENKNEPSNDTQNDKEAAKSTSDLLDFYKQIKF